MGLALVAALLALIIAGLLLSSSAEEPTPAFSFPPSSAAPSPAPGDRYVAPGGDDAGSGSRERPFATVARGLESLRPGETLWLRAGTYDEDMTDLDIRPGRPAARITVAAYPGERAVIRGLLWLEDADYWTLYGLEVTWAAGNDVRDHMVKMTNGVGWQIVDSHLWGARSFAALLVAGTVPHEPSDWVVRGNCIHDVLSEPIHHVNGDHNLYINTGTSAGPGLVERNVLFGAPNGQNIKLGFGRSDPEPGDGTAGVTIRFNTLYGSLKNLSIADDSHDNTIERNLIEGSSEGYALRSYRLSGTDNVVRDNLLVGIDELEYSDADYGGVTDGGGNTTISDAGFDSLDCNGFHPSNPAADGYGRYGR